MTALLHIGPGDERVLDDLRESGIDVRSSAEAKPAGTFDVVMISPDVDAPLQVARTLRTDAPDAHIVFLTTPATDPVLRRELLLARIGTQWSIAPADEPRAAADVVRQAIAHTERRKKLRTTLGNINVQLAQKTAPPRRALISDHFLASVLDQLSDAIVVLDPSGGVLAFNAAAGRAFGDVRRGAPFGETLPPAAREAIQAAAEAGEAESIFTGEERDYGLRATSLRDADGTPIGIALVARDITAGRLEAKRRKLVADAVRTLAATLDVREALQNLTDLLVAELADVAAADVIEGDDVNRYAASGRDARSQALMERSLGINMAGNRNHPSMAVIARGETVVRNDLDEALLTQLAANDEHRAILLELAPRAMMLVPLRGEKTFGSLIVGRRDHGPFTAAEVALMQEIARQAASALHNIWSYHAASEASRLKDEFLATLSHELRTPMTSILGWAQILRFGEMHDDLVGEGLESIERSARAQAQLIDDLLDLSRLQMGKLQFHARPFSLTTVVRAAVDTVRPAAQARGVALVLDAPREVVVCGDPDRMQQVIWNLLSNAVKFSDPESDVRVTVESAGAIARVVVADRGRGIAPDFLPHVFERFRQADSATTRRFGGLGLGLAIVKQLVELHGGSVTASSPGLGRGATFTVTLPASSSTGVLKQAPSDAPLRMADLSGLRLLIVEDDPASATTLKIMLERAGAEVRVVHSVAAALEALRERLPDVLLSDVAMPNEDGLALIRAVRGTLRITAERLPAIALTAFSDVNLRVTVLGAGFQRFLSKPVDADTLSGTVAALARKK